MRTFEVTVINWNGPGCKSEVPISKYTHKLTNKPPVVAATR